MTACGGSNNDTPIETTPDILIAKATDGTLTDVKAAFDSGNVISASGTETAALILDYEADTSAPTDATLTFRRTSSGDLEKTINEVTTVFTSADLKEDGYGYSIEPEGGGLLVCLAKATLCKTK